MPLTKEFFLAGHAIFTVTNNIGEYYTYLIRKMPTSEKFSECHLIYLLTGPDNTSDYTYMGRVDSYHGGVILTQKSRYTKSSKCYRVADWALHQVWQNKDLPAGYSIRHVGRCGRCGRELTTPRSLDIGLGPICEGKDL